MHQSYEGKGSDYKDMYFQLIKSDGRVGMYHQINKSNNKLLAIEVILLDYHKAVEYPKGVFREAAWVIPNKSKWGKLGWSYNHFYDNMSASDRAEKKYSELIAQGKNKFIIPKKGE